MKLIRKKGHLSDIEKLRKENAELKDELQRIQNSILLERQLKEASLKRCEELLIELENSKRKVFEAYNELLYIRKDYKKIVFELESFRKKLERSQKIEIQPLINKIKKKSEG